MDSIGMTVCSKTRWGEFVPVLTTGELVEFPEHIEQLAKFHK
jgi:hypothetical protein